MADTMTIGRLTQLAPEISHGVAPAGGATKQLIDLTFQLDPSYKSTEIRGTGRRFLSTVVPDGQEASAGKVAGTVSYNSWVYLMSMIFGPAAITTPAGAINARKWSWTVPLTGSINPQSMDIEQGDSVDSEQFLYSVCDSWGIDATRSQVQPAGTFLMRAVNKAAPNGTFGGMTTVGVTQIPSVPVLPKHWSIFMDPTSANIGVTKMQRAFHGKLDYGGAFVPFFPLDNALPSYGGVADGDQPKVTFMMELMKDPLVGEALWPVARAAQTEYIRFMSGGVGVSTLIDNYWTFSITGTPTGGSFTVTIGGVTSGAIAFNATSANVVSALTAMSNIGAGGVTATGGPLPGTPVVVTMAGTQAQNANAFTLGTNSLTGGASPTPAFVATQIPYSMTYDFAGKVQQPGANKDLTGLRTREWTFNVVEDPTWGNALLVSVINALTSL